VKEYYGKILSSTASLKTSACTASSKPHAIILRSLKLVPQAVKDKYYGCGSAVPLGIEGLDILDLGSGSGQDCYVAASLVGPAGSVIGLDMTEEQLKVARDSLSAFAKMWATDQSSSSNKDLLKISLVPESKRKSRHDH
jgi:arsenite methyltransferase